MTGGRGLDGCIDAVGLEHGAFYDKAKQALKLSFDRPTVLHQTIQAFRKRGTLSIPGVYGGLSTKVPLRTGQTHMHKYLGSLLKRIQDKEIDPSSFLMTHRFSLDEAPRAYKIFRDEARCI
jgi:threonine dehydrogenase-like Zn-dependent dehydrogenase